MGLRAVFDKIENRYCKFDIDFFAYRLNTKTTKYVSRYPEPDAVAVDAFTLTWSSGFYYVFPPFSLINRVIQKIEQDRTEAMLVGPL